MNNKLYNFKIHASYNNVVLKYEHVPTSVLWKKKPASESNLKKVSKEKYIQMGSKESIKYSVKRHSTFFSHPISFICKHSVSVQP